MNPHHHALSSVAKYGGKVGDYLPLHKWFDDSKRSSTDPRHRALKHHSEGISMLEEFFGQTITNSSGREIPTRYIGEQHVQEDLGKIPCMMDWYREIKMQKWMFFTMQVDTNIHEKLMRNEPAKLQTSKRI